METEVREFVAARLGIDDGTDDRNLIESGLISSLDFLELLAAIEEQFGVEVDFADLDPTEFTTLSGLAKSVARLK